MHWSSRAVRYLRKHLEETLSRTGAPDGSGKPSWEMAEEGLISAEVSPAYEPWPDGPPDRVWVFGRDVGRLPILIGQDT